MRTLVLILTIVFLALPATGRAALSVDECVQRATEQNSGIKSSDAATIAVGEEVNVTRSALFPTLKLKSYYTLADRSDRLIIDANAFAPGIPPQKSSISTGSKDSYGLGLSLRQPLFTGGRLINVYRRAEHESAAASHAHLRQRALLAFQVRKTFNEALIAASRIKSAEKGVQSATERLRVVQARREEGYADQEELLHREADLAVVQSRLIKARNRSDLLLSKLRYLIGAGPDEEMAVSGKPVKLTLAVDLNELTRNVINRREDIKSAVEKSAAADAGIRTARSGFSPQLFLEGNYLRQKETSIARPELWTVTMQAEWSLFEWGRTVADVRKAVAQRNQLDFAREELSRSARMEIEETWRDVIEIQSMVTAQEKVLKSNEASFVKSIDRYLEGAALYEDVISRESALWDAYDNYCQSAAALSSAFAALEASSSADLEQWTTVEELYLPDFETHSSRIRGRISTNLKQQVPELPLKPATSPIISSDKPLPSQKEEEAQPVVAKQAQATPLLDRSDAKPAAVVSVKPAIKKKQAAGVSSKKVIIKSPVYRIQLGAFQRRKQAQNMASLLASQFNGKKIDIRLEGKFFKPLAGPYSSIEEAEKTAKSLELKEYLVVRRDSGQR